MCRINNLSNDELQELLDSSSSYSDAIRRTGLSVTGGHCATLKKRIRQDSLSTDKLDKNRSIFNSFIPTPLEEILVEHSTFSRHALKKRLVSEGVLDYICSKCGNDGEWEGEPLTLQIDHINGNNTDNRIENLTFLCPNCHTQTSTYAGRNKREKKTWLCRKCNKEISAHSTYCKKCIVYPSMLRFKVSYEDLYDMVHVQKLAYTTIGKKFGVSDNAIRKRCKRLGIPLRKHFTRSELKN